MKKQFKAESKKLMDLMINSIYTNKDIFLREIISNASDAIDKLYYNSLTDDSILLKKKDYAINIKTDVNERTITISDNGIGMSKEELETNLGTIAKSGSLDFKENNEHKKNIDIIGQFGVGFYSAFMVASKVEVISKKYGSDEANKWESTGIDGYSIEHAEKATNGTDIIITLKENTEDEHYDDFLNQDTIARLVKMYSNYITYPIKMSMVKRDWNADKKEYDEHTEIETLNDMVPLWKKSKSSIKEEDYNNFYKDKFNDYENPQRVIHTSAEGLVSFNSLLFIPSNTPYDFYTKEYEKGLKLYSNGVLIMDKCKDLLPDYYSFVKGIVDTPDLSLNISREMLQEDRAIKKIASNIEKKILSELESMLKNDRDKYLEFFKDYGTNLKYGLYENYGEKKDKLKDLILLRSFNDDKLITFNEYVSNMKEGQKDIYYAIAHDKASADKLPQMDLIKAKGYDALILSDDVDEFMIQILKNYNDHEFKSINKDDLNLISEEESKEIDKKQEDNKELLDEIKKVLTDAKDVKLSKRLVDAPCCVSTDGEITFEMERVLKQQNHDIKAERVFELNPNHPMFEKIKDAFKNDKELAKKYVNVLYAEALLQEGILPNDIMQFNKDITELLLK